MRIAGGTAKRITKRIINFILVIWGVVTLSFCLQVFTGTDPAEMTKWAVANYQDFSMEQGTLWG